MPRKTKRDNRKGGSAYAAIVQKHLPRCDGCGRGFVTLKVVGQNGKMKALCQACRKKALEGVSGTGVRQ